MNLICFAEMSIEIDQLKYNAWMCCMKCLRSPSIQVANYKLSILFRFVGCDFYIVVVLMTLSIESYYRVIWILADNDAVEEKKINKHESRAFPRMFTCDSVHSIHEKLNENI